MRLGYFTTSVAAVGLAFAPVPSFAQAQLAPIPAAGIFGGGKLLLPLLLLGGITAGGIAVAASGSDNTTIVSVSP